MNKNNLILGLDVSTKTIGIVLFEDLGDRGALKLLTHVTPNVKPKPKSIGAHSAISISRKLTRDSHRFYLKA